MRPESSGRWHAFSLDVIPRLVVTAALGGFTVFYRPLADHPEPAHLRELSIGLVGVLAAISFVQALASVRSRPVDVALWVVAADGAVALAFGWLYSFDPRDLLLTPLLLVMVEAALNLSPRAALSAWALLSVGYAAREGWAQRLSGVEALPLSVVLRMGLGLLIVLVVAVHRAQRRRAERELAERAAWLASVVATHQAIATSELSLETVLTLVVERVQRLTNATAAIVELAEGQEMVYRSASGTASAHVGLRLDMDASLSGRAMTLNEVLVSTDTETDPRVDREACRQVRARSMAVVPLSHTGRAVGVLKVISPSPDAFGEQDVQTLQLMAGGHRRAGCQRHQGRAVGARCSARRPHRSGEHDPVHGSARASDRQPAQASRVSGGRVHRPRPLQAGQRPNGASGRKRAPGRGGGAAPNGSQGYRHRGPVRR